MMELLKNKRNIILAVSVCLFAVALLYRMTHVYKQPKVAALTYTGEKIKSRENKTGQKDLANSTEEPLINLDRFSNPQSHSKEAKKNIFSGQAVVEEQKKPLSESASEQKSGTEASPASVENQIEDDLSTFKSFGYIERGGERILFIEKGKQIMLVRKGDRIEGKYIVRDISKNELTLTVIANNETVHIDLSQL
jgi:Tfp pilus assembly protein PilP